MLSIERVLSEYGNPISGGLDNKQGTLGNEIPAGSQCTLIGTHSETGEAVIPAGSVALTFTTVGPKTTLTYVYTPATPDFDRLCTMRVRFKIVRSDNQKVVYVPDAGKYAFLLTITAV